MRILFLITELTPAGAEKVVSQTALYLKSKGVESHIVSLKKRPEGKNASLVEALEKEEIPLTFLNGGKLDLPFLFFRLLSVIKKIDPDLIHAHLIHPILLARLANIFTKKKLVNTLHIAEKRKGKGIFFLLDRLTYPLCDAYTGVSKAAVRFQEKKCHLPPGSLIVIPNGSNAVTAHPPAMLAEKKREWGLEDCTKIAGAFGRLDYQKGYDLFLSAIPFIAGRIPEGEKYGFLFMGEGPEGENLRKTALLLEKEFTNIRIAFPGFVPEAAKYGKMLDLFLMPSRYEGYGLALAESFSLGVPALHSGIDSLPEICQGFIKHNIEVDFSLSEEVGINFFAALHLPRFPEGKILHSVEEMGEIYLQLYKRLTGK